MRKAKYTADTTKKRIETWNSLLRSRAVEFASSGDETSVFVFSSHKVLTEILDNPTKHNFEGKDVTLEGGGIWVDRLHLTAEVHAIIAKRFLNSLVPGLAQL